MNRKNQNKTQNLNHVKNYIQDLKTENPLCSQMFGCSFTFSARRWTWDECFAIYEHDTKHHELSHFLRTFKSNQESFTTLEAVFPVLASTEFCHEPQIILAEGMRSPAEGQRY